MTAPKLPKEAILFAFAAVRLPRDGATFDFVADEGERSALAAQLGILTVRRFSATVTAKAWRADGISVRGRFRADVEQASVVTLDPVRQRYDEPFEMVFVPEGSRLARIEQPGEHELLIDPEGDDPPETFYGDKIDLGPYLSEALALALDPYPRDRGERFDGADTDEAQSEPAKSAFAVLSEFKARAGGAVRPKDEGEDDATDGDRSDGDTADRDTTDRY